MSAGDQAAVTQRDQIAYLLTPKAIRAQCHRLYALAQADRLANFRLHEDKLPAVAAFVLEVTREAYPTLDVPYHSRWRHFDVGGVDREAALDQLLKDRSPVDRAKAKIELAIVSVLLDAGAGAKWTFADPRAKKTFSRSEGLAVASFEMFVAGAFSSDAKNPCSVDATALAAITPEKIAQAFQVDAMKNPLVGLEGRAALLKRLGGAILARSDIFGGPRLGGMVDLLLKNPLVAAKKELPAPAILAVVLDGLGPIWPGRVSLGGVNLGDVWRHPDLPAAPTAAFPGGDLVPFHKLSQWLTYSLCEPFEGSKGLGLKVSGIDELTGLPEYRNGGLFLDMGVLTPKKPDVLTTVHQPDAPAIVEWRALTVALLDKTGDAVRRALGKTAAELPLAKVLQGGTWTAGRKTAQKLRPDGSLPILYASDGTLF